MRLIQFETATGQRHVGVVEGEYVLRVCGTDTTRELAQQAIAAGRTLADHVQVLSLGERHDYRALLAEGRVLPPLFYGSGGKTRFDAGWTSRTSCQVLYALL